MKTFDDIMLKYMSKENLDKCKEEIEDELNKLIEPHKLSLKDSMWLMRLLNKFFNH